MKLTSVIVAIATGAAFAALSSNAIAKDYPADSTCNASPVQQMAHKIPAKWAHTMKKFNIGD
ncbi:hypothetical protein [Celerinatantimonas sp. YJH-8]|uniref:hypothetical protein n=1 Tax=Celerinatantimonas sp. YJH-8 TaxID=3228714 RepID=UPI0038C38C46